MTRERIEKIMKVIVPELMREFTTQGHTRTPKMGTVSYGPNLWDNNKSFEDRFLENVKKELEKNEDNYPLLERLVNAYNESLLK